MHQALKEKGPVTVPREFVFMDRAAIGLGGVFLHLARRAQFLPAVQRGDRGFLDRPRSRERQAAGARGGRAAGPTLDAGRRRRCCPRPHYARLADGLRGVPLPSCRNCANPRPPDRSRSGGFAMADHGEVEYATATGNDYAEHEATYEGFVHLAYVGSCRASHRDRARDRRHPGMLVRRADHHPARPIVAAHGLPAGRGRRASSWCCLAAALWLAAPAASLPRDSVHSRRRGDAHCCRA